MKQYQSREYCLSIGCTVEKLMKLANGEESRNNLFNKTCKYCKAQKLKNNDYKIVKEA